MLSHKESNPIDHVVHLPDGVTNKNCNREVDELPNVAKDWVSLKLAHPILYPADHDGRISLNKDPLHMQLLHGTGDACQCSFKLDL